MLVIGMGGPNTHCSEACGEFGVGAFALGHAPPCLFWEAPAPAAGCDRLIRVVAADRGRWTTSSWAEVAARRAATGWLRIGYRRHRQDWPQ
jgi:hypothetical protein